MQGDLPRIICWRRRRCGGRSWICVGRIQVPVGCQLRRARSASPSHCRRRREWPVTPFFQPTQRHAEYAPRFAAWRGSACLPSRTRDGDRDTRGDHVFLFDTWWTGTTCRWSGANRESRTIESVNHANTTHPRPVVGRGCEAKCSRRRIVSRSYRRLRSS